MSNELMLTKKAHSIAYTVPFAVEILLETSSKRKVKPFFEVRENVSGAHEAFDTVMKSLYDMYLIVLDRQMMADGEKVNMLFTLNISSENKIAKKMNYRLSRKLIVSESFDDDVQNNFMFYLVKCVENWMCSIDDSLDGERLGRNVNVGNYDLNSFPNLSGRWSQASGVVTIDEMQSYFSACYKDWNSLFHKFAAVYCPPNLSDVLRAVFV